MKAQKPKTLTPSSLIEEIDKKLIELGLEPTKPMEPETGFNVILKRASEKTREELDKEREQVLEAIKRMAMGHLNLTEEQAKPS